MDKSNVPFVHSGPFRSTPVHCPSVNIKLIIAYDGTGYLGWQKTKMGPSIEASLQSVLEQILQEPITLQAASRTDAGVHAKGQVVNFVTKKERLNLNKLRISLNSLLPKDIAILTIEEAPDDFHPTLDCYAKEYHYFVCLETAQMPQHRLYSWHCHCRLDLTAMEKGAQYLVGTHAFTAFCNFKKGECYENSTRTVERISIVSLPQNRLRFEIVGQNFLYKMVRNIVGTLIYVGKHKIQAEEIPHILTKGDRTQAGITAPAHGLFLHKVYY